MNIMDSWSHHVPNKHFLKKKDNDKNKLTFYEWFLCTKQPCDCFNCLILFNPHNYPVMIILLTLFSRRVCWASLVAQLVKNLSAMWETWVRFLGWEDPLERGMANHSSILAWRIPWTVQSMGSQRVGHNWETFTFTLSHALCLIGGKVQNLTLSMGTFHYKCNVISPASS